MCCTGPVRPDSFSLMPLAFASWLHDRHVSMSVLKPSRRKRGGPLFFVEQAATISDGGIGAKRYFALTFAGSQKPVRADRINAMKFPSAHKKIRRANKHIADIRSALERFCGRPDSYTARIDFEPNTRQNVLCIDIRDDLFPQDDVSSSLANALHNLRNALNHMFYQVVITCGGSPTEQTCFPIRNSRKDVVARIETL